MATLNLTTPKDINYLVLPDGAKIAYVIYGREHLDTSQRKEILTKDFSTPADAHFLTFQQLDLMYQWCKSDDDEIMSVQGTSASSPLLAGILTIINGMLMSTNRSPLGFLNPLRYSGILQDGFNDITEGNNPGCGTSSFPAAPGWDPVTGFGTPNFPPVIKALGL